MKKLLLSLSIISFLWSTEHAFSQSNSESGVIYCESFGVSRPLRELAEENPANLKQIDRQHAREKIKESKDRKTRDPQDFKFTVEQDGLAYGNDPSLFQSEMGSRPGPSQKVNVAGQQVNSFRPMDPSGAIGPNYYVQMINSTTIRVYNSTTGATVGNAVTLGTLWNPDLSSNDGDPIVMYDRFADRWFLAQFGTSGNKIYIAVSTTNDPMGSYYTYTYTSPQFPDYLKFSIWQDGYYMTSNQSNQKVFAFERSAMLAGSANARSVFTSYNPPDGGGFFCPLPGDADGNGGLPPAGTPCPIFSYSDNAWGGGLTDAIQIYQMAVNWTPTTPTATISFVSAVPTSSFDASYNFQWNDIAQPGTTQKLDGIGGVLTYRAQWRKWAGYNTVVLNWGVRISANQRSIMWAELRQNQSTGAWSVYQQQIYVPDALYRWVGSIAMDDLGNIGLCYVRSGSSGTNFPSCAYTGRLASDPLNQMTFAETTAAAGSASYSGGGNRFGDYSHTTLSPDGSTFWHTSEYGGTNSSSMRTRVYSFQLALPTNANVSISSSDTDNSICAGTSVTFTATPTNGGTNPSYQWQLNGTNVGTNSPTYTNPNLSSGSVVTCIMTSNQSGATNNPATSNAITTTVNSSVTPSVTISGNNTICSGTAATFTAGATNSGSSPSYQWQVNGNNVGVNSPTLTSTVLTNGATVTCTMTSNAACVTTPTATSNTVTMNVTTTPATPTITNNGGVLTSSATAGNQWYFNGSIIAGATGQTYTPTANGVYTVVASNNGCTSGASVGSTISGLGVEEMDPYAFTIYPNPSQGDFTVSFNAMVTESYSLRVFDEMGKLVYDDQLSNVNGETKKDVRLGRLATGAYTVVLSNGAVETKRKMIIKR
jgi:hypothetical protein